MDSPPPAAKGWLRRLAYVGPGLLLTCIALNQIRLAHTQHLTPWKGGGFGMFSSADRVSMRMIRASMIRPDGQERRIAPGKSVKSRVKRARSYPSDANLESIAERMAERSKERGRRVAGIRLEFWKHEFDNDTAELRPIKVREYLYDVPEGNGDHGD